MGCRLIEDRELELVCMYCSTTMRAFGPVFDSVEAAEDFIDFMPDDPRGYPADMLMRQHDDVWHDRAYDDAGEFVGWRTDREPTDDDLYNRPQYVPDSRDENDRTL